VAQNFAEDLSAPAHVEFEAEVTAAEEFAAVAEVARAAEPPRRNATTIRGGGARAPGLCRRRRQSLVGAAALVRDLTVLEPVAK
jgi:hypothetical protein